MGWGAGEDAGAAAATRGPRRRSAGISALSGMSPAPLPGGLPASDSGSAGILGDVSVGVAGFQAGCRGEK